MLAFRNGRQLKVFVKTVWHGDCSSNYVLIGQSSAGRRRRFIRARTAKAVQIARVRQMRNRSRSVADDGLLNEMVRMTQDVTTANDQRVSQRFKISAPLTVIVGDREIPAYTRDLSNRGVYFYLALADSAMIDRDFEFLIDMPPEITLSTRCRIRCRGRAIRKESALMSLTGVAAEILDYLILREAVPTN